MLPSLSPVKGSWSILLNNWRKIMVHFISMLTLWLASSLTKHSQYTVIQIPSLETVLPMNVHCHIFSSHYLQDPESKTKPYTKTTLVCMHTYNLTCIIPILPWKAAWCRTDHPLLSVTQTSCRNLRRWLLCYLVRFTDSTPEVLLVVHLQYM